MVSAALEGVHEFKGAAEAVAQKRKSGRKSLAWAGSTLRRIADGRYACARAAACVSAADEFIPSDEGPRGSSTPTPTQTRPPRERPYMRLNLVSCEERQLKQKLPRQTMQVPDKT